MHFTVGMPVHNLVNYSALTIYSLLQEWNRKPHEHTMDLVIVDNASTDNTKDYFHDVLQDLPDNVIPHWIGLDKNYGCSKAFNKIIEVHKQVNSDILILINNDLVFSENWLEYLIEFSNDFGECGTFSPSAIDDNHLNSETRIRWFGDLSSSDYKPFISPEWEVYAKERREKEKHTVLDGVSANCWIWKKDCIEAVGEFDENFVIGCYDDVDAVIRAEKAGFRVLTCYASQVFHFGGSTQAEYRKKHGNNSYQDTNRQYFQRKWGVNLDAVGGRCCRSMMYYINKEGIQERLPI